MKTTAGLITFAKEILLVKKNSRIRLINPIISAVLNTFNNLIMLIKLICDVIIR